jgi:hypothetical protein
MFEKGAAGHSCAETLRQEGFTGKLIIVTKDENLPYDRTKLSKAMNLEAKLLSLRSNEYYLVIFYTTYHIMCLIDNKSNDYTILERRHRIYVRKWRSMC